MSGKFVMKESKEKIKNEKIHRKCKFGHCEKRSMERIRGEQQTLVSEKIIIWEDKKQGLRRTRKL